jgi:competence protein ComEC
LSWLIRIMNGFIEHTEHLPFALWNNLRINIPQLFFLYAAIAGLSLWVFQKKKFSLQIVLIALLCFVTVRSLSFWQACNQQKLVVYNIPQHQAIDFIEGRNYLFKGDSILLDDGFLQNFHLKPSRVIHRVSEADSLSSLEHGHSILQFGEKRILIIDQPVLFISSATKTRVDVIIISKNPGINISNLSAVFNCRQWVFDASNATWNINKWKQECEQLHLSCYSIVDKGAFVMNMD